jgi:hypothetical protein
VSYQKTRNGGEEQTHERRRFGISRRSRFLEIGGIGGERTGKFEREEIEEASQLCLCAAEE